MGIQKHHSKEPWGSMNNVCQLTIKEKPANKQQKAKIFILHSSASDARCFLSLT